MGLLRTVISFSIVLVFVAADREDIFSGPIANDVNIKVDNVDDQAIFSILRKNVVVQSIHLDEAIGHNVIVNDIPNGIVLSGLANRIEVIVIESRPDFTLFRVSRNLTTGTAATDCINLHTSRVSWYGGPQQKQQYWPIEKLRLSNYSYLTKEADNCGLAERYWLNSDGSFVYVDLETPLFINQNIDGNNLCLVAKKELPYDRYVRDFTFKYYVGVAGDARKAHLEAVRVFLKKPTDVPDERMIRHPIWSTWARYKRDINEEIVLKLADEIVANKFNNSQFEIDDLWEICYGSLTFDNRTFPNVRNLTNTLKAKGFRVTLWVHPFINKGCEPWYSEAKRKGYLVTDHNNSTDTQWWNSERGQAAHWDFTNPEVAEWYSEQLRNIQKEHGIDTFKFDAGETSWTPPDPILNSVPNLNPSSITIDYIRTVSKFGPYLEVRSGQNTQDLPIFVRMIDKDSEWTWNNGLPTLVTTLLQMNLNGYIFVLPDMIGGNGYNDHPPNKEMFIRWLQANVFMPSLQFSYVPWDFDVETIELSRNLSKLHADYTDVIVKSFKVAVERGEPVNPPIWWLDPNDRVAQQVNDEFLLGDSILAAPVLEQGANTRHIYLPRGRWIDGNTRETISGPRWLMDYPAPLNVLPHFIRHI